MIEEKIRKKYSSPDAYERTKRDEEYAKRTDEAKFIQAEKHKSVQKNDSERRPFKPVDYEEPPNDDEPGYKEW